MYKLKSLFLFLGLASAGENFTNWFSLDRYDAGYSAGLKAGYTISESSNYDKTDRFLFYALGGCTTLLIGAYLYERESNDSVINRVDNFYNYYVQYLESKDSCDIASLVQDSNKTVAVCVREAIFRLRACMNNRYGSWVKPWDWSSSMLLAYKKIQLVTLLCGYIPLLHKAELLKGEDVASFARETFAGMSMYPCITCLYNLEQDIVYARQERYNIRNHHLLPVIDQVLSILERARTVLRSERDYLGELQAKKGHDLQMQILLASLNRR